MRVFWRKRFQGVKGISPCGRGTDAMSDEDDWDFAGDDDANATTLFNGNHPEPALAATPMFLESITWGRNRIW
jgi:hypothetical protein